MERAQLELGTGRAAVVLTDRQRWILPRIALGTPNPTIARETLLTLDIVKHEIRDMMAAFGCGNREHLVAEAFRQGYLVWWGNRLGVLKGNDEQTA